MSKVNLIVQETYGDTKLNFSYDANGNPYTFSYTKGNNSPSVYHYVLNLQGDVVRIVTNKGVTRVTYEYDAWGNITNMDYTNETLANANPLRYRGYYYDRETGLYYLQSRYYNPQWGRFINADAYASTGQGVLGNNMFAYCCNNPVNAVDPTGTMMKLRKEYAAVFGGGYYSQESYLFSYVSSVGLFGWLYNLFFAEPDFKNSQILEEKEEQVLAQVQVQPPAQPAVFYGVDFYFGQKNFVTGPMYEEEAILWAYMTAYEGTYTKREGWGLYTEKQVDAFNMAVILSPLGPIVSHASTAKHMAHYHTVQRRIWGIEAPSFHIWYGGV